MFSLCFAILVLMYVCVRGCVCLLFTISSAQLKKQLKNLGDESSKRKTDLSESINCLESSEKHSISNLSSGSMGVAEVSGHVKIVTDPGHKTPTANMIFICKIYSIELLEKRCDSEWVLSLVPADELGLPTTL